jgi:hypothetical protein
LLTVSIVLDKNKPLYIKYIGVYFGGERGIRTLDTG